jgi:3-oxoacyl-(acyl-carrier-protein) synthase
VELNTVMVQGIGAVSPAGWNVDSLRDALAKGQPLPGSNLARPGFASDLRVRRVPTPSPRPDFLGHPRLRRASPISQFAVGAALEALGTNLQGVTQDRSRLGIIFAVMAGCIKYSRRFYDETLRDPATASPLVFPETVFNAPASHLAAILGSSGRTYTFVGDPGMFLVGLALGATWLADDHVDSVLIVGAEEIDWLAADAFRRFERHAILSEGAGAVYLRRGTGAGDEIHLQAVTDSHSFLSHRPRLAAAQAMRAELPSHAEDHLLCDGTQGLPKLDLAEKQAWANWTGPRLALKPLLGEGLAAASAWQCVAAIDALRQTRYRGALVSIVGCNQQAIGAHFIRAQRHAHEGVRKPAPSKARF